MAAGLGFKDFTTGEVLTAADVDGYLMQGVWVFASATARDAAVTSPQEGNFAYLKDTNTTTYYTGSAWTNLDTTGMVNPMTTTGDMIYSSSGSTPARLGLGTANQQLRVNAGATAPEWFTPAAGGGGKVLQVVQGVTTTSTAISSTTFTDTTLTATITPTLATSKILIIISQQTYMYSSGTSQGTGLRLLRGGTDVYNLSDGNAGQTFQFDQANSYLNSMVILNGTYLDSPATTSATTYKTQGNCNTVGAGKGVTYQNSNIPSTITLLEIGV